jgi:plasmid stabilization system protein ParE
MPRGEKDTYTDKQKRKAEHIEDSYESRGVSKDEAEARAWATVNKQTGGGEKAGSGRKTSASQKSSARHDSAKRAVATKHGHSPNRGSAAAKSSSRSSSSRSGSALADLNKQELMKRAASRGIRGRSRMRKQELIEALR